MNARHQLPPTATPSQYPVERLTVNEYVDQVTDQYRRGCALEDLTCKRLARFGLMRDLKLTYRQACHLLP